MKTITFTDFCKNASGFITEVEHGDYFWSDQAEENRGRCLQIVQTQ